MNGIHDLGGMHGLGPIDREDGEPVFHEAWEGRALAVTRAMLAAGHFNLDEFRHGIERMAPAHYLESSYYEHWLEGTITLLAEKGIVNEAELAARAAELAGEDR
ncbi:MAG: nitrile hydratase subunit beta [Alphaproteobacteria bacterium]|nr:nitrile hydratase subunit beta [Alphaproteobacteria bacterium]